MKKVVVIGSGLAGLTAAYYLSKYNTKIEVTLLEAGHRVGGKVYTSKIDGHNVDVGGFMVFPFYKHFMNLLEEVELQKHLIKINKNEFFNLKGTGCWTSDKDICYKKLFSFKFLFLIIKEIIRKRKFPVMYEPDLELFDGKSLYDVLHAAHISEDKINIYKTIISGYTYASFKKLPAALFVPLGVKLLFHGMFNKCKALEGGTVRVVTTLKKQIEDNGGKVLTSRPVAHIAAGHVVLENGDNIQFDHLIIASQVVAGIYVKDDLFAEKSHTVFDFVTAKLNKPITINDEHKWFIGYASETKEMKDDAHFTSFALLSSFSSLPDTYLGGWLKWPTGNPNDIDDTKIFVKDLICEAFKGYCVEEVCDIHRWRITMPCLSVEQLKKLSELQGRNSIWFAGDYLAFPSMETAVYTGKKAADNVINSIDYI